MAETDRLTIPRPLRIIVQDLGNRLLIERAIPEQAEKDRGEPVIDVTVGEIWPLIRALQLAAKRMHTYDSPQTSAPELKVS